MMDIIPVDIQKRREAEITYYQWVPLILIFQAFLFKLPNVIWKVLNRSSGLDLDKICKLTEDTQLSSFDDRKRTINNLAFFMDSWLHTNRSYKNNILVRTKAKLSRLFCFFCDRRQGKYLTALYLSIKVIYVGNVIVQFLLLNAFMATEYTLYGLEYFNTLSSGEGFKDNPRFPKVAMCDFKIRQFQNIQRWSVQCILPINLFNENIFTFLWFWFFVVACLCIFNLIKWVFLIVLKQNNYRYVKKYLTLTQKLKTSTDKKLCRKFAESYLKDDGCFVARMVGTNAGEMVVTDLLDAMWVNYRVKESGIPDRTSDDEVTVLSDTDKHRSPRNFKRRNCATTPMKKI